MICYIQHELPSFVGLQSVVLLHVHCRSRQSAKVAHVDMVVWDSRGEGRSPYFVIRGTMGDEFCVSCRLG